MPKLKTHKGTQKRFGITGTGKITRLKQGSSHLRRNKTKSTKRQYHDAITLSPKDKTRISRLIPYGAK
ncbi:MAG: 50S ribosomal protein L35 [Chloroflexi bacterium]|nr:50S ribosomal protein L35 [Chloroflexota bacterium]